ncbi:MAG: ABC transporter ATP-binding protein [Geminicoccaceae bacterium]|jgi:spermidine/putrescine transport system ATP-binding protein|nr:ABC transporter ATP-binding protein [Geminicoccaceae bacterium]HRY25193.1 ABC transporter ATP-binding protein [Geminicoccaceae bacterium]
MLAGQSVTLERVSMAFGDFVAVRNADLHIEAGEFFSFLGPSGCGKTTILRLISGFNEPTGGAIRIGGADMAGIGPNRRPTALIFQNLALFPLMKVWENVAFGLEARGVARAERRRRAAELLELVALEGQGEKLVSALSGGQRQRVAIARALAVEPAVLLLDEPLSALDLKLRQKMRAELRTIQQKTGVTFVYITHDQGEALTMSDRIAVMSQGRIEQVGTADAIYREPASAFVATFVGESNVLAGRVTGTLGDEAMIETAHGGLAGRNPHGLRTGVAAQLVVRPERCRLLDGDAPGNRLAGTVERLDFEGAFVSLVVRLADGTEVTAQLANDGSLPRLKAGTPAAIGFPPEAALLLPVAGDG